jgi:hypothetical protein
VLLANQVYSRTVPHHTYGGFSPGLHSFAVHMIEFVCTFMSMSISTYR